MKGVHLLVRARLLVLSGRGREREAGGHDQRVEPSEKGHDWIMIRPEEHVTSAGDARLGRHLTLGTLAFAVCFAAWGLVSAFAVRFRERLGLTATETAFLVAVPVLLGALARLPMGILADRFGGRVIFSGLMAAVALPVYLVPAAPTYPTLLVAAFFLGLAGSSFSVGVVYVSRWSPPARQGSALGLYGLGTMGQSAAVFLGPLLAGAIGWERVFHTVAAMLVVSAVVFAALARDAPARTPPQGFAAMMRVLVRERLSWALSAFYFLTFGGFVAFSIYLPTLLKDDFGSHRRTRASGLRASWSWPR
jgi:NNP family nitrate/nitrite transporter-like MFS transporter